MWLDEPPVGNRLSPGPFIQRHNMAMVHTIDPKSISQSTEWDKIEFSEFVN